MVFKFEYISLENFKRNQSYQINNLPRPFNFYLIFSNFIPFSSNLILFHLFLALACSCDLMIPSPVIFLIHFTINYHKIVDRREEMRDETVKLWDKRGRGRVLGVGELR